MKYFVLNPRDPLIIRSSRPFEAISDAEAAKFPPPSTIAGALRNLYARSAKEAFSAKLLEIQVTGPLAIKIPAEQPTDKLKQAYILVPKPADAQYFAVDGKTTIVGMQPVELSHDEGCDLPHDLLPLFVSQETQGKPLSGPKWWALQDLLAWRSGKSLDFDKVTG
ncbi:type III-B CRISPR module-associated Cmr3 family protein [Vibrio sp. PP-XX7]